MRKKKKNEAIQKCEYKRILVEGKTKVCRDFDKVHVDFDKVNVDLDESPKILTNTD
jgi:hypothetical protein